MRPTIPLQLPASPPFLRAGATAGPAEPPHCPPLPGFAFLNIAISSLAAHSYLREYHNPATSTVVNAFGRTFSILRVISWCARNSPGRPGAAPGRRGAATRPVLLLARTEKTGAARLLPPFPPRLPTPRAHTSGTMIYVISLLSSGAHNVARYIRRVGPHAPRLSLVRRERRRRLLLNGHLPPHPPDPTPAASTASSTSSAPSPPSPPPAAPPGSSPPSPPSPSPSPSAAQPSCSETRRRPSPAPRGPPPRSAPSTPASASPEGSQSPSGAPSAPPWCAGRSPLLAAATDAGARPPQRSAPPAARYIQIKINVSINITAGRPEPRVALPLARRAPLGLPRLWRQGRVQHPPPPGAGAAGARGLGALQRSRRQLARPLAVRCPLLCCSSFVVASLRR